MARKAHHNKHVGLLPIHGPLLRAPTARKLIVPANKHKVSGYAQVSDFISTDKELAVYRRFDETAARLLLGLQSEIILKQKKLDELDKEDARDPDEKRFLRSMTIYEELPAPRDPRDEEKDKLCERLRKLLKEYYELLNAQSEILKLSSPADRVKDVLFEWFEQEKCLVGLGREAYFEDHSDLVALRPAKGEDRLSQFLRNHCSRWFEKKHDPNRAPWNQVYYFPESRIAKAVGVLSTITAGLLLVGAIGSLYSIKGPAERLRLLAMWTMLFAATVSLFSTAKRSEVFAATAAYAAVLVVFVSGNLASPGH